MTLAATSIAVGTGAAPFTLATAGTNVLKAGTRNLCIPLGLFFTHHVSQYFPLASVAGCNDIRISVKLRSLSELIQLRGLQKGLKVDNTSDDLNAGAKNIKMNHALLWSNQPMSAGACKLRCHYVHVTGPEAQVLMNKEHVRLLKLWQHQTTTVDLSSGQKLIDIDLSFLHPVCTLVVTIRRANDMTTDTDATGGDAAQKGFFFYHGDGNNPNYDRALFRDGRPAGEATTRAVNVKSMQLMLNGMERHSGLPLGIERDYLQHRLLPMLHSNSSMTEKHVMAYADDKKAHGFAVDEDFNALDHKYNLFGSKNIYVYPFSLNPEGSNPSGAVNFSKVSHAKLKIHLEAGQGQELCGSASAWTEPARAQAAPMIGDSNYQVDVYALYYNWLQIKDGRALLSFA